MVLFNIHQCIQIVISMLHLQQNVPKMDRQVILIDTLTINSMIATQLQKTPQLLVDILGHFYTHFLWLHYMYGMPYTNLIQSLIPEFK